MFLHSERMSTDEKDGNLTNEDYDDLKKTIDDIKAKKKEDKAKEG